MAELAVIPAQDAPVAVVGTPRSRDQNPYWTFLARFGGEALRTMRGCLDRIAAMLTQVPDGEPLAGLGEGFPWELIRYQHVTGLRSQMAAHWSSPATVNKHLSALRGVCEEAWLLGLSTAEDYQRIRRVKNLKGTRLLAGRNIHEDEISAMLAGCLAEEGVAGIRNAALVATLKTTGIRRAEAAGALIEKYDPAERALQVIGKGGIEREVYFHQDAVPYLDRWLVVVGERRGPMFRPVDKWGNIGRRPMTPRSIGQIVDRIHVSAGVAPLSAHDFRRSLAGDLLDAGADLVQVQGLLGHARVSTTALYDRRPARARRAAIDKLSLPSPEELTRR